ncbi:DUF1476 domain-containing protein [Candidatus Paracaedibacter symbiosus]|uniref:DUF1476 domain-containing protein n=1 Tax=Candidatus Paracaedibacter symbiosus TaxID=244582 RepID=UPI0005097B54|nr:DUF1476 domain-containing protein [Candidatus Paracaedibacter symbiosus]
MSIFSERERAFENYFMHQEEIYFQVIALRNKLFAKWIVEHMDLDEHLRSLYIEEIGQLITEEINDTNLLRRAMTDLNLKGITITLDDVDKKLNECHELARQEFLREHL